MFSSPVSSSALINLRFEFSMKRCIRINQSVEFSLFRVFCSRFRVSFDPWSLWPTRWCRCPREDSWAPSYSYEPSSWTRHRPIRQFYLCRTLRTLYVVLSRCTRPWASAELGAQCRGRSFSRAFVWSLARRARRWEHFRNHYQLRRQPQLQPQPHLMFLSELKKLKSEDFRSLNL